MGRRSALAAAPLSTTDVWLRGILLKDVVKLKGGGLVLLAVGIGKLEHRVGAAVEAARPAALVAQERARAAVDLLGDEGW